jgi:hypothetical protein
MLGERLPRIGPRVFARLCLAFLLLVSVISGAVPLGSASGQHLCAMACCAGKPPHEAGSCMMNACEATAFHQAKAPTRDDPICDPRASASGHAGMETAVRVEVDTDTHGLSSVDEFDFTTGKQSATGTRGATSIAAAALSKPCPPECGGATCRTTSKNTRYDSPAPGFGERPRPLSLASLRHSTLSGRVKLQPLCKQLQPRAPPQSS